MKIEKNAKIGDNNAIGDNAIVIKKENVKKMWFTRHPWLSAIICSVIAGVIFKWKTIFEYIIELLTK